MRIHLSLIVAVVLSTGAGISALAAAGEDRLPQPQYEQTKQVIALVKKAAEVLKREGPQAFSKFRQKNSEWFHGDSYVFVSDLKGESLCHPFKPTMEGTNVIDLKDVDGKRPTVMMIDTVSGKRAAGWVHYKWPRSEDATPSWKSSYIVRVKDSLGNEYLLGSGIYGMKVEKLFIVETVDEAARLVGQKGKEAFPILRDKAGPFRYRDVYVYVSDQKGNELVSAGFPELEGTNLWDLKDANGKLVVQDQIKMLETKDAGWIDYVWPKPGETKPSKKLSYVRKVKSSDGFLYVGAGLYAE